MFTILENNVVDFCYSMLLGRPWLRDVKVAHDWGSKIVTTQGNGIVKIITVTKCLGGEIRIIISVFVLQLSKWYDR